MASDRHQVVLRVTERGYEPYDAAAWKQYGKIKVGTLVEAEIARGRSVIQNARYWAVLTKAVEATDWWSTPEELHNALKVATGKIDIVRLIGGTLVKVPGSTSFRDMNQEAFNDYQESAFAILADKLEMSVDDLLAEANAT
jgi:hypothetical protein